MTTKRLQIPLSEKAVRELRIGDLVRLDGPIFTGSHLFHERMMKGILPPIDFKKMNVLLHWIPLTRKVNEEHQLLCITPTSSIGYNAYGPEVIKRLGVRAIIGKTTMGTPTMKAMQEFGAVHLTRLSGQDNPMTSQTKKIMGVYFEKELGITQATLVLDVENFGPFIVSIDTYGNNLFKQLERDVQERMKELYRRFGVSADFDYPQTNAYTSNKIWTDF